MTTTVMGETAQEGADHGPGLWRRFRDDGSSVVTNIRLAGEGNRAGSGLINAATGLLFLLAVGLFVVSLNAQYTYVFHVKHQSLVSLIEAISLDAGMAIFSLLALGLARAGKSARIERMLILLCAAGSSGMNFAAANVVSPRSVPAYVVPPVFLAVVVDRVVAVVRRHVLGDEERSPWAPLARAALYATRFVLAPPSTAKGIRQAVLQAAPVPEAPKAVAATDAEPAIRLQPILPLPTGQTVPWPRQQQAVKPATGRRTTGATRARQAGRSSKTKAFLAACEEKHGALAQIPLADVYKISQDIAPLHELHPTSARNALRAAIQKANAR